MTHLAKFPLILLLFSLSLLSCFANSPVQEQASIINGRRSSHLQR